MGETYINMGNLEMELEENLNAHVFSEKLSKILWNHGIKVGELNVHFYLEIPTYLK